MLATSPVDSESAYSLQGRCIPLWRGSRASGAERALASHQHCKEGHIGHFGKNTTPWTLTVEAFRECLSHRSRPCFSGVSAKHFNSSVLCSLLLSFTLCASVSEASPNSEGSWTCWWCGGVWRPHPLELLSISWTFQRRKSALPLPTLGLRDPLCSAI